MMAPAPHPLCLAGFVALTTTAAIEVSAPCGGAIADSALIVTVFPRLG
jgi:hypothetical protein